LHQVGDLFVLKVEHRCQKVKQSDLHQIFQSITFENIYENRPRILTFDEQK